MRNMYKKIESTVATFLGSGSGFGFGRMFHHRSLNTTTTANYN